MLALTLEATPEHRLKKGDILRVCELRNHRAYFGYPDGTPAYVHPETTVRFERAPEFRRPGGTCAPKVYLGTLVGYDMETKRCLVIRFAKGVEYLVANLLVGQEVTVEWVPPVGSSVHEQMMDTGIFDR